MKKKKSRQVDLRGNDVITMLISKRNYSIAETPTKFFFKRKDSVWDTLKYIMASGRVGTYHGDLVKDHANEFGVHFNTVSNNIKKLAELFFIRLVAKKVGPHKNRKYYAVNEKGRMLWEKYINEGN